jgi:hypothetical protein
VFCGYGKVFRVVQSTDEHVVLSLVGTARFMDLNIVVEGTQYSLSRRGRSETSAKRNSDGDGTSEHFGRKREDVDRELQSYRKSA